jgi:hypothetical protein
LAFWSAPIGSAVITFLVGYPAECAGDAERAVENLLAHEQCNNLLGFDAVMPSEAGATVTALIVGAVFYGIASLVESHLKT